MAEHDTLAVDPRAFLQVKKQNGGPPNMGEIGVTGLERRAGRPHEEFLSKLHPNKRAEIYKEMSRNDPVISAGLLANKKLMLQSDWRVEPADQSRAEARKAEFIDGCMHDMSLTWPETLEEILSFLDHGWSVTEIVYKRRNGDNERPGLRSKFDDGRIGWRKFAIRGQETIEEWEFDDHGGVQAFVQRDPENFDVFTIPIEKMLLFRTTSHVGNPEGLSILRGAYVPYYRKKEIETIEGIGIERDLAGLPVAQAPAEFFGENADPDQSAALDTMKEIVQTIRNDEQAGIVIPYDPDESGNNRYGLKLLNSGGEKQFDTNQIITRYDQRIAVSMLADFILLGQDNVGSFALASSKTKLFSMALDSYLDRVAEVMNRHAIPRLLRINGMDTSQTPELVHGDVETPDLAELGLYLRRLSQSGAPLFPDEMLEDRLRDLADLPEPSEEDREDAEAAAEVQGTGGMS